MFGATSQEKAIIWQEVCEVENIIVPYLRQFISPIFFGGLEDKQDEVIEAAQKLSEEFSLLNGVLADRDWLAGDKLSAADIVTYPMLKFIERAATKEQAQELNLDLLPYYRKISQPREMVAKDRGNSWCSRHISSTLAISMNAVWVMDNYPSQRTRPALIYQDFRQNKSLECDQRS